MKKNETSASKADATAQGKLSFGKAILILMGLCSLYALLIPERVLTNYPFFLPFVETMESILPAIKGFARLSPIPEVVRFYYATMWIIFPVMYAYIRIRKMADEVQIDRNYPIQKALLGIVFFGALLVFAVYLIGILELRQSPLKPLATGGQGNLLAAALTSNSISIGVISAIYGAIIGLLTEIVLRAAKRIFGLYK
jgi:hypothetical protein